MKAIIVILASVMHLIPHSFGASSVGAMAIYGGAKADRRVSWLVPLIPLLAGNLIFGFYDLVILVFVYAGFALSAVVAGFILARKPTRSRYAVAVVSGALIFFLLSNFAVWYVGMYPPTIAGLVTCYLNGLPYLATATLVDGSFCLLLFGLHRLIDRKQFVAAPA